MMLTVAETAALLRTFDNVLILTHVRPDGDPVGCAAALCAGGVPVAEVMQSVSVKDMFVGIESGSIGEISALALLIGGLYLLWRRVITWHIPVAVLGSMAIFSLITWLIAPEAYMSPLFHLMGGGGRTKIVGKPPGHQHIKTEIEAGKEENHTQNHQKLYFPFHPHSSLAMK